MNLWIKNALILPMTRTTEESALYFRGAVALRGRRICFVSDDPSAIARFEQKYGADFETLDAEGKLLMPGLINLHTHTSMTLMRSYADDMPLMPWLTQKIWPFEAKLDREDIYWGALLSMAEMLTGGTTTFVDMYWQSDRIADAALESGIRAVICPPFVEKAFDGYMTRTEEIILRYHGKNENQIQVWIAPHAPYTCPPDQIREALTLCDRYGIGVHIHLCETRTEIETIAQSYGKDPVTHLRDLGVFNYPTLAAHCVHITPPQMEILQKYRVSVSHNPQSNMKLSSGIAPVTQMQAMGINVGLGTDGCSSNNDLDLWEEMRTAALLQKVTNNDPCALPAYEVLKMATVHGAQAIGLEGELGIIAEGALADLLLIDLNAPHLIPCHDLISNLVYCAKASDVDSVIVGGEMVVRHRQLVRLKLSQIRAQILKRIARLTADA